MAIIYTSEVYSGSFQRPGSGLGHRHPDPDPTKKVRIRSAQKKTHCFKTLRTVSAPYINKGRQLAMEIIKQKSIFPFFSFGPSQDRIDRNRYCFTIGMR
jgi:hypothetical protein